MGIDLRKRLTNSSLENLNNLIEELYKKSKINKFSLINYKEMYSIDTEQMIFIDKTYIQISNIEKFEFEYNFYNEYKIFGNGILIGFVYIDPKLEEKEAFLIIENYLSSYKEDYLKIDNPDYLIKEIIKEQTLTNFKIDLKEDKVPFYRQIEFKHRKKEKFKC
jgi:hypothetical protein